MDAYVSLSRGGRDEKCRVQIEVPIMGCEEDGKTRPFSGALKGIPPRRHFLLPRKIRVQARDQVSCTTTYVLLVGTSAEER